MTVKFQTTASHLPTLPGVQFKSTDRVCTIKADVTGFYADDIKVTAQGKAIVVEFITKHSPGQSFYLGEQETEHQLRAIPLDFHIDSSSIRTHWNNGKLEILAQNVIAEREATAA